MENTNEVKHKYLSNILVALLGAYGMFYWGFLVGIASLLGMMTFIILTTYFGFDVNIWYQVLIRIVFLIVNSKLVNMTDLEIKSLKSFELKGLLYLIWTILLNFLVYGFIFHFIIKTIMKFIN